MLGWSRDLQPATLAVTVRVGSDNAHGLTVFWRLLCYAPKQRNLLPEGDKAQG